MTEMQESQSLDRQKVISQEYPPSPKSLRKNHHKLQDPESYNFQGKRIHSSPMASPTSQTLFQAKKASPRSTTLLDQLRQSYQSIKEGSPGRSTQAFVFGMGEPQNLLSVNGKAILPVKDQEEDSELKIVPKEKRSESVIVSKVDQSMTSEAWSKDKPYLYYVYGGNYPERIREALQRRGNWVEIKDESQCLEKCHFVWRPVNYNQPGYQRLDKRVVRNHNYPIVYNHFEVLKGLVTKTGLIKSLKHYYCQNDQARTTGYQAFDSTPTTFLLQQSLDCSETTEFMHRFKELSKGYSPKERTPMKHCANNIWLVKPAAANQGRGIEIFRWAKIKALFKPVKKIEFFIKYETF